MSIKDQMARNANLDSKVYVGDLGNDASAQELEDAFGYYGPLKKVWVARRPPGFAFVEFEDPRDAEDACRAMDGKMLCGRRVKVELSSGRSRWPGGRPPSYLLRRPAPRYVDDARRTSGDGSAGDRDRRPRRGRSRSRSRSRSYSPRAGGAGGSRRRVSYSGSRSRSRSPVATGRGSSNRYRDSPAPRRD